MPLIKNNRLVQDTWHIIYDGETLKSTNNLVDLAYWQANRTELITTHSPIGLLQLICNISRLSPSISPRLLMAVVIH